MKQLKQLTILTIIGSLSLIFAAPVTKTSKAKMKYDLETNDQIPLENAVQAVLPKNSKLVHVVTTGVFGPADGSLGANINVIYTTGKTGVVQMMIFQPIEVGKYKKIPVGNLQFGAREVVNVEAVFFDQIDKDAPRELFILCSVTNKKNVRYETIIFDWTGKTFRRMIKAESKLKNLYPSADVRTALPALIGKY